MTDRQVRPPAPRPATAMGGMDVKTVSASDRVKKPDTSLDISITVRTFHPDATFLTHVSTDNPPTFGFHNIQGSRELEKQREATSLSDVGVNSRLYDIINLDLV
jgi:hypothetical protein